MDGLTPIILEQEIDKVKKFRRLDTKEIISLDDFEILQEMPVLFTKPQIIPPQVGVYAHATSLDFNEMPENANAVLLSKRTILQNGLEVYAGQYCRL